MKKIAMCLGLFSCYTASLLAQGQETVAERWIREANIAPPFTVPASKSDWENARKGVRAELWNLLGRLPSRPNRPNVTTLSREDRGDYILEKFTFPNGAGESVPGYLLLPKTGNGKHPAILYCHWHAGEYDIGKEELFQAKHTPEPPGPAFARRGYVVLAIDARGFGERNGHGPDGPGERNYTEEETASKFDLWAGRSFWGMVLHDDLMALDYLASRPEVDNDRIGVTGMSMGATRTWWLMALDERIKAGVAIACVTHYTDLIKRGSLFEHDIGYFVPGMLAHFDSEAVIALIAPRPILFQTGDQDHGSPVEGIHAIEATVRQAYSLYGKEDNFRSIIYPGQGHIYTPEMWAKTLSWMDSHLAKQLGVP